MTNDQKFKPLLNGSLRNFFLKDTIVVVGIDILLTWGLPSKCISSLIVTCCNLTDWSSTLLRTTIVFVDYKW